MNLNYIDLIAIFSFIGINFFVIIYYRKRYSKDVSGFFLGNRRFGWLVLGSSMVATTFAVDTPLLISELVSKNGISGNWLWWNAAIGGMLTVFFFARLWRRANITTDLEFIRLRYGDNKLTSYLRIFKSIYLGFFLNLLIIGWINLALITWLSAFLNISQQYIIYYLAICMIIVGVYVCLVGFLGVIVNDVIQFSIAMLGFIALAYIVVTSDSISGIAGLKDKLPDQVFSFLPSLNFDNSQDSSTSILRLGLLHFISFLGLQWWSSWYPGAEPGGGGYIAQRIMSAKNEEQAIRATLFFQICHYCLRPWPWIIIALCALVLYPDIEDGKIGFVRITRDFLPSGFKGLFLVVILSAYMSTLSTQLNWGASYLVNDFYLLVKAKLKLSINPINVARGFIIILIGLSLWVVNLIETLQNAFFTMIECGAGLGLVLILRWYWWRINVWSEIIATIASLVGFFIAKYVLLLPNPNTMFFIVGFTTVSWVIATFLTEPVEEKVLIKFCKRVRPQGSWGIFKGKVSSINNPSLLLLLLQWVCGVIMIYTFLFAIGKFIFQEWAAGLIYLSIAIINSIIVIKPINK